MLATRIFATEPSPWLAGNSAPCYSPTYSSGKEFLFVLEMGYAVFLERVPPYLFVSGIHVPSRHNSPNLIPISIIRGLPLPANRGAEFTLLQEFDRYAASSRCPYLVL